MIVVPYEENDADPLRVRLEESEDSTGVNVVCVDEDGDSCDVILNITEKGVLIRAGVDTCWKLPLDSEARVKTRLEDGDDDNLADIRERLLAAVKGLSGSSIVYAKEGISVSDLRRLAEAPC